MTRTTNGSTLRLSDAARELVLPDGIVSTSWPSVNRRIESFGVRLDPWQDSLGRAIFGKREDGKFACGVGGAVISIPRQVGKTFLIGMIVFAVCINDARRKAIWTAHRTTTADETFEAMKALAADPGISPHVRNVRSANGEQRITFTNGSRIEFGAREHGFGRGKTKVSLLVLDEAQILTESAMENLVPSMNQGVQPLMFLMGTPPRPRDPGEVFTNRRIRALNGASRDTLYVEFSADRDARIEDRAQWSKANPSYPSRTPEDAMLRMMEAFGDASFRREALGIWDETSAGVAALSYEDWSARVVESGPSQGVTCFGVKFSADGAEVALGAARRPGPGAPVHVEGVRTEPMAGGTQWLTDFLTDRADSVAQIVVDGKAHAGYLVQALLDAGVPKRAIIAPSLPDVLAAHSMFAAAVRNVDELTHAGQELLDQQALWARKREIGKDGGFGWKAPEGESVALLEACTFAFWAARTTKRRPGRKARLV